MVLSVVKMAITDLMYYSGKDFELLLVLVGLKKCHNSRVFFCP